LKTDALIILCKERNQQAQSELFINYKDKLFALCLKYCRNVNEAEDNLQESFIKIFQKINQYNGKGNFEGWMKRIVINNAIDMYKKEVYINSIDEEKVSDTSIEQQEVNINLSILLQLIQELPSRYRLVFNLYEMDNYSHKEISQMLSISEGTSKSNLHRAKIILKEQITKINTASNTNPTLKHG